jgi:lysophospholipid acyltransferase
MSFFASPAKPWLVKRLNKRNHPRVARTASQETMRQPTLGLPVDPGREIDEALQEIKQEVEMRRRKGSKVTMPKGQDLKVAVEEKLGKEL